MHSNRECIVRNWFNMCFENWKNEQEMLNWHIDDTYRKQLSRNLEKQEVRFARLYKLRERALWLWDPDFWRGAAAQLVPVELVACESETHITEERCYLVDVSTSVGALRELYETSSGNPKKTKQKTAAARSFVETILTAITNNSKEQDFLPLPCFPIFILCSFCQNPSARKLVGKEEI